MIPGTTMTESEYEKLPQCIMHPELKARYYCHLEETCKGYKDNIFFCD
jgi:hypothetical protein